MMLRFALVLTLLATTGCSRAQQVSAASCDGPTAYIPIVQGFVVPGTPTYAVQSGWWTRCSKNVTVHLLVATTDLGGAVGALLFSIPLARSSLLGNVGNCFLTNVSGWTGPAGYTVVTAGMNNPLLAAIYRWGSGVAPAPTDAAEWAAASSFQATCEYLAE